MIEGVFRKEGDLKPKYRAGVHYKASSEENRILIPDLSELNGLRHRWCWERRSRPYVPVWNFGKAPNKEDNAEESARLFCVYMRPWTLCDDDVTADNPLLENLGLISVDTSTTARSYVTSWGNYIDGNVVSELSRRYINNIQASTATPLMEAPGDSSESSEGEDFDPSSLNVGSMKTVHRTLNGSRDNDDGAKGFGRYASSIRLGRTLWQSPAFDEEVLRDVREQSFSKGTFPDGGQIKKAWRKLAQAENARPLPFANATPGRVQLSVDLYGARIDDWFAKLRIEKDGPTDEQWYVLRHVRDRVLLEYRLEKEGMHLPKGETREREEEPLRGLIHGPPGSGKSELIKFLRRFFTEALQWTHGVEFMFVAYQNKVAHAMKGITIHNAGMLDLGQQSRQGEQTDVDVLFTKNQDLKWVLVDEVGMVSDHLLGSFGHGLGEASNRPSRFKKRHNGMPRIFGGDVWRLSTTCTMPTRRSTLRPARRIGCARREARARQSRQRYVLVG